MTEREQTDAVVENQSPVCEIKGRIFDIQRFSIHDGPGIRTTVFLKGCPLRCAWCHNPEGMNSSQTISFLPEKCIACGECVRICEHHAHSLAAPGGNGSAPIHIYRRERCEACGRCTAHCDSHALETVGRNLTVEEVMKELRQDKAFYASSGGGVSVSGGEPLAQIDFTTALLAAAGREGIHRCVETSGFASWARLLALVPQVDLFLFDFKETNPQLHAAFTGQSNELILSNLRALYDKGANIQLQCPIVPGFNDREEHIDGIAALAHSMPKLAGVQLLPYHPLGKSKIERFGFVAATGLPDAPLPKTRLEFWIHRLRDRGVNVLNTTDPASR
jgi:pyruvate formate lyase activating enzyme